jgi:hypothetical protein
MIAEGFTAVNKLNAKMQTQPIDSFQWNFRDLTQAVLPY